MPRSCRRCWWFLLVLVAAVVLLGCQKAEQPGAETPVPDAAPVDEEAAMPDEEVDVVDAASVDEEVAMADEEVDVVAAARGLGTPTEGPVVSTESGLQYIEVEVGEGAAAKAGDTAVVHYTGWLVQGKKFDSSVDRGQPFRFPVGGGRVIRGWDEGVAGMKVGGVRKLIIPADLGYGSRGAGGGVIPPNSTLIFEVELLAVE